MESQDIRNLQEAYMEVYNDLNEMSYKKLPVGKMMRKVEGRSERKADTSADLEWLSARSDDYGDVTSGTMERAKAAHQKATRDKERSNKLIRVADTHSEKAAKAKSKLKKEQADIYDIILSHLLDEGYAESPEAAEAIMVNMSEEWIDSIVEENMEKSPRNVEKTKQKAKERKDRRTRIQYYGKDAVGHGTGEHLRPS